MQPIRTQPIQMQQLQYVWWTLTTTGQVPHATVIVIATAASVFPEKPVRNVLGAAASTPGEHVTLMAKDVILNMAAVVILRGTLLWVE
mmetsp:Transcript_15707/g.23312  ORF Transcript_15707/g.23312 Transcript_15707/m.23312 type:complete len:88 (+) Transcript_15707:16-279(+)